METIWIILLILSLVAIILFIAYLLVKTKQNFNFLELNEIKAQLNIIASTGSQSQKAVSDALSKQQETLNKGLESSLANLSDRLNLRLTDQTTRTTKELSEMQKRLAVIDSAQKNILELTQQVSGLQNILSNKQARGSFGEVQLENIIKDILSDTSYSFQHTLSNGKRVDCLVRMPGPPGNICIDSKFPLEAWRSFTDGKNENDRTISLRKLKQDTEKHIKDISEKYIIPGETAETAVMFLPSESIYAGINVHLSDSIIFGRQKRVFMAGPDNLMLLLHTVRAVLRDASMSEMAGAVQSEVAKMMEDVNRLDDRVSKLINHFTQAQSDLNAIQISTRKVTSRGQKIEEIEVDHTPSIEKLK
jgi:DNA recombination protein RmuC